MTIAQGKRFALGDTVIVTMGFRLVGTPITIEGTLRSGSPERGVIVLETPDGDIHALTNFFKVTKEY